ncbi:MULTISPECIES: hypothetical protein [Paenibacillus]|uniref:Uncharacterized protein n=1 Tax=Paenibacillus amylolyticus TaxID=1451 RepID=A0ABD8ARS9_PAEAM|nr:hypothetical protein [Paenibacillus sp. FSL H7-689]ETT49026.1 hypothetical protein C170_18582 [Paenibacillus sp. FSL H7-689]
MKRIALITSLTLMLTLVLSTFSANTYADNGGVEDDQIKELNYNYSDQDGLIDIDASYEETKTGEVIDFNIKEENGIRTVKHFIDNKLVAEAIYDISSDEIVTTTADGEVVTQKASEMISESDGNALSNEYDNQITGAVETQSAVLNASPGFNFVKQKYNTAWKQYGSIYQKQSVLQDKHYKLNISAGTAIATVITIIDIYYTKGKFTTFLKAMGITILGVTVDSMIGAMDATRYLTQVEVYSQGMLGLASERYIVKATFNGKTAQVNDGGDERTYDELIDIGVYNVVLQKL